jgi:hypothetical protein
MSDRNNCYSLLIVVDLIANPPITNTDAPQFLTSFYFEAPMEPGIVCETEGSNDYSVLGLSNRFNSRSAREVITTLYINLAGVT